MRCRNTSVIARIAPAWITMLKKSERAPSQCWAISRWPVLETGRNSVSPSRMPSRRADSGSDMESGQPGAGSIAGTAAGRPRPPPAAGARHGRQAHDAPRKRLTIVLRRSHFLHHFRAVRPRVVARRLANQQLASQTRLARRLLNNAAILRQPEAVPDVARECRKADQGPQGRIRRPAL